LLQYICRLLYGNQEADIYDKNSEETEGTNVMLHCVYFELLTILHNGKGKGSGTYCSAAYMHQT